MGMIRGYFEVVENGQVQAAGPVAPNQIDQQAVKAGSCGGGSGGGCGCGGGQITN